MNFVGRPGGKLGGTSGDPTLAAGAELHSKGGLHHAVDISRLNIQDAMDLAVLIEMEAQESYEELVQGIGTGDQSGVANFFKQLAETEAKHAKEIIARREALFGNAPIRVTPLMFWDIEVPQPGVARTCLSARRAMEVALAAEVKAHDFFVQALQSAKDEEVRKFFSERINEEKDHQDALRRQIAKLPPADGGESGS